MDHYNCEYLNKALSYFAVPLLLTLSYPALEDLTSFNFP